MRRTTKTDLKNATALLNAALGLPPEPYTLDLATGTVTPVPGVYHLDGAYGGWRLVRMSDGGGCVDITPRVPTGELYRLILAMLDGVNAAHEAANTARVAAMRDERDGDALMHDAEVRNALA